MTTLAVDKPRVFETGHDENLNEVPMIDNVIIYDGAAVGDNGSGLGRALVGGDVFIGFNNERADNTRVGHAASAVRVKIKGRGVVKLSVVGVTGPGDRDKVVYASDDDTFTLTSSGASGIGRVLRWETGTTCLVAFQGKFLKDPV